MAEQTGDNVTIGGATYSIATDWGSGGGTGFTSSHVQVIKTAWGDTDNTFRTTKTTPLPIQIFDGVQGTTAARVEASTGRLLVTGGVSINDSSLTLGPNLLGGVSSTESVATTVVQIVGPTFGVSGPTAYNAGASESDFQPVKVTGAVRLYDGVTFGTTDIRKIKGATIGYIGGATTGYDYLSIQGISGGTPVGITLSGGDLDIRKLSGVSGGDTIGVVGVEGATAIEVTGGVVVASQPSGGSFEIRNLLYGRDSIAIGGLDGSTAAHVKIVSTNGTALGASGDALKVAIDNGNFTANVTVDPVVYVRSATGSSGHITVRGITNDEVTVRGPLAGGAIEVNSTSGLNTRSLSNTTDNVDIGGTALTNITNIKTDTTAINNSLTTIRTVDLDQLKTDIRSMKEDLDTLSGQIYTGGTTADNSLRTTVSEIKQPSLLVAYNVSVNTQPRNLGSNSLKNGVNIQADPQNSNSIIIGGRNVGGESRNSASGYVLEAGDSIFLNIANTNQLYCRSKQGNQKVNIIGT